MITNKGLSTWDDIYSQLKYFNPTDLLLGPTILQLFDEATQK